MSLVRSYVRLRWSVGWVGPFVFLALAALLYGLVGVGKEWQTAVSRHRAGNVGVRKLVRRKHQFIKPQEINGG